MITTFFKIFLFIGLGVTTSLAQVHEQDTLLISGNEVKINLLTHFKVIATPEFLTPENALTKIQQEGYLLEKATIGFTRDTYWGALSIKNISSNTLQHILEVSNPQIDCLQVYTYSKIKITPWVLTGDKFSFDQRLLAHRNFIFPITLAPGENKSFLFKIEKRNSSLNMPLFLWSESGFHQNDYTKNFGYGLYFGFIILCALYSILAFGFLRNSIYLWYFIWIISSGIFVFTALGFSSQFFYPSASDANSIFRIIIQVINVTAFLKFSQKFLRMDEFTPGISNVVYYSTLLMVALTFPLPFRPAIYFENSYLLLPFLYSIMILSIASIIYSAVKSFSEQRVSVLYYFAAFAALIAGGFFIIANEFGMVAVENLPVDPFLLGSTLEFLIFSMGITYQIKKVYDQRNDLSFKFAKQQKELLKAYVDGVERERERISRDLHDNIGSRLSSLNRFASTSKDNQDVKLQEQIEILCEDVRNMSHQLAPAALKIAGLKNKVLELSSELKEIHGIQVDIQFYDFPEDLDEEKTVHIYRIIQEAFNNISKHANASVVDLQFFGHEDELVVTIEDNGKGFKNSSSSGIGLQNMQARSESLQGTLEINSQPGRGTQLLLKIPNEKSVQ